MVLKCLRSIGSSIVIPTGITGRVIPTVITFTTVTECGTEVNGRVFLVCVVFTC